MTTAATRIRRRALALLVPCLVTLSVATPAEASAEEHTGPPPGVTDWLNERAIALQSVDAGSGFDDLAAVGPLVGDARLVGVGEATHGSSEFFRFKHRFFEYLVERLGFTAFVMEAGYAEGIAIDRYLQTGEGTAARAARATRFWTWNTPEVAAMLQWMRDYNADPSHERKIRFYGNDIQFPDSASRHVLRYLQATDPEAVEGARQVLAPFLNYTDLFGYAQLPQDERDAHEAALEALLADFDSRRDAYVAVSGEEAWAFARQAVVVTIQGKRFWETTYPDDAQIRDAAMAENTLWALDREGTDGRAMLWAHNGHLVHDVRDGYTRQGVHLRQALGDDYLVVGQHFDRGRFTALKTLPPKDAGYRIVELGQFTVGSSREGSLNDALASADPDMYIVDIRDAADDAVTGPWWRAPRDEASIGAVYTHTWDRDDRYSSLSRPDDGYDLLVQIDVVTAAPQIPL